MKLNHQLQIIDLGILGLWGEAFIVQFIVLTLSAPLRSLGGTEINAIWPKIPLSTTDLLSTCGDEMPIQSFFHSLWMSFPSALSAVNRGQQPSRSRILPSCDQYTCLPCDSLALENKLELPCMAFPGKFNELQERNVANYSMPNFPSFVYWFIYLFILEFFNMLTVFFFYLFC